MSAPENIMNSVFLNVNLSANERQFKDFIVNLQGKQESSYLESSSFLTFFKIFCRVI